MAKFLKNISKGVSEIGDAINIPIVKDQRNGLQKEKHGLEDRIKVLNARKVTMKLLEDALTASIAANQVTIAEILGYFRGQSFTPLTTAEEIAQIENLELRALNTVYNDLVSANIKSGEVITSLQSIEPEITQCETRIGELTIKIQKLNDKLDKLRGKA